MTEIWESTFARNMLLWGEAPTTSAVQAAALFADAGVRRVLIPGIGYGRNAMPFLARDMSVEGIEISATAIALAKEALGLDLVVHHGSVTDMPFSDDVYDAVFAHGLLYLLDAAARAKLLADCARQLRPGGELVVTVLSKAASTYGRGRAWPEEPDRFDTHPGVSLSFFDRASIAREFAGSAIVDVSDVVESNMPFFFVRCRPGQ